MKWSAFVFPNPERLGVSQLVLPPRSNSRRLFAARLSLLEGFEVVVKISEVLVCEVEALVEFAFHPPPRQMVKSVPHGSASRFGALDNESHQAVVPVNAFRLSDRIPYAYESGFIS